jgi:transposase
MRTYVGIDIGKRVLQVSAPSLDLRVQNDREGFASLISATRPFGRGVYFACEASANGSALLNFLYARHRKVCVLSPYRVRQFAKATGRKAKTDDIDAAVIADAAQTLGAKPTAKPDRMCLRLRAIIRRRAFLVKVLNMERLQGQQVTLPILKKSVALIVGSLRQAIEKLDCASDELVRAVPDLRSKFDAMCNVAGVGGQTAKVVLAEFPEIGRLSKGEVAALGGLAPFNKDSGDQTGARHIQAGRFDLRRSLYMPAISATQRNPVLRPFYKALRARGKPHRVALVAVMRKLLIYLNKVVRDRREVLNSPVATQKARKRGSVFNRGN